ncbi:hypothetical protein PVAND_014065 [Polypedilum vanderplanki]|uniref:Uncharacterized protein n=1 Tax=Polypedilum vanderplanki TaxID=319348 RepID=A0A9J6CSL2_POLVA|nr:hypothetical protein PVAND_014065 [Polypedilum vanderplanki]
MDPFMSSCNYSSGNCTNRIINLTEIINQYHNDDSCELPDLYKKYGDLFDNDSDPTQKMGEEQSEYNIQVKYICENINIIANADHQQSGQANQCTIKQHKKQQPPDNKYKEMCIQPSIYLTPVPTPSPYANPSSPESSRKRTGGRPTKDIIKAEKEFKKKSKNMSKSEKKKESNNISCLKHRRRKSQKLKDLLEEEIKLFKRNKQLIKRHHRLESNIVMVKEIYKNNLKTPEDQAAFEIIMINLKSL